LKSEKSWLNFGNGSERIFLYFIIFIYSQVVNDRKVKMNFEKSVMAQCRKYTQ